MKIKIWITVCFFSLFAVNSSRARWLQVDPKAETYYPTSPYAYCTNNPVKFIDPNGEEVWIYYQDDNGNSQKLLYTANMEYAGSNSFVSNVIGNLNAVYSYGGDQMLNTLIRSENAYNFVDQLPSKGTGSFQANENGGGTIFAGNFGAVDFSNVEMTGHELFHGLQHEYDQGGASIFNEVEAMVFGNTVATNWSFDNGGGSSMTSMGLQTQVGRAYENAFNQLQFQGYSQKAMTQAINNFQRGAYINASGIYNGMRALPVTRNGSKLKSILSVYLPRIR